MDTPTLEAPALPTAEQLAVILKAPARQLTKRNLRITQLLIQGERFRQVARDYRLSPERVTTIFNEVTSLIRQRHFSVEELRGDFANYLAIKAGDLRRADRQAWWVQTLEQLIPLARCERDYILEMRPILLPMAPPEPDYEERRRKYLKVR